MQRADIITKVEEPTDWVSPLVITTKKDGKLRVCLDPRKINECLKREHYEMPRREDRGRACRSKIFLSPIDASSGLHTIPLD